VLRFNIGAAAERLRHDARAIEACEAYLAAMPDAPNAASVRSRLEILRRSAPAVVNAADTSVTTTDAATDATNTDASAGDAHQSSAHAADESASGGGPNMGLLVNGALSLAGAVGSAVYWADRASVRSDCGGAQGVACLNADTLDRRSDRRRRSRGSSP